MARYLLGALVGVLLVLAFQNWDQEKTLKSNAEGWETVCTFIDNYEYTCEGLSAPLIVEFDVDNGYYGWYEGGPVIFVNANLKGIDREATIFHETIHYIHWQNDLLTFGEDGNVCWSENEAFYLEDLWLTARGYEHLTRPNWWTSYRHCWPEYASDEFLMNMMFFESMIEWGFIGPEE